MPNYNLKRHGRKILSTDALSVDVFLLSNTAQTNNYNQFWEHTGQDDDDTPYSNSTNPSRSEVRLNGNRARNRVYNTGTGQGNNVLTTGVTYSSTNRNWSFTQTGIYEISFNFYFECYVSDNDYTRIYVQKTRNNSTYSTIGTAYGYVAGEGYKSNAKVSIITGINDVSNDKIKLNLNGFNNNNRMYGSTLYENTTWCQFLRIGDI